MNQSIHHEHTNENHDHTHEDTEKGIKGFFVHFFKPHSHDVADSIDDPLAGSKEGIRAVKLSLLALGTTAILQLFIVSISGSVALLADTIHNFSDASTAIPLWLAFSLGRRAVSRRYTYGFGRVEDIAGIFIVFMISASALLAGWESLQRFIHPQIITNIFWVAIAGFVGFVGNEMVAQYRIKTGQKIGSAALITDGYHARTDGFTSLAVLLGAIGVWLGFPLADPLVGLGITIAILFVLKDALLQIWHRLMDAVDPELIHNLEHAAQKAEGVETVSQIKARWIGHSMYAEARIIADCELSLSEAHRIAEQAKYAMQRAVPKLSDVIVHVDPCGHNGEDPHAEVHHNQKGIAII